MSKLNDFKVEFSPFGKLLKPEYATINPDIQWTPSELCDLAVTEAWNLDTMTEDGYLALKALFFRLTVPKEHWNDIDEDKFFRLVLNKYESILSDDL